MPATIREATEGDNAALVDLARLCPMHGEMSLCIERSPDFFALSRLFGDPWRVFVAEDATGKVIGCTGLAFRQAYFGSQPRAVAYLSDVKVHREHRGPELAAADRLIRAAIESLRATAGDEGLLFFTIMAGNRNAEKWGPGLRGSPPLTRFATLDAYSVPLIWAPPPPRSERRVVPAEAKDVGEMIELWRRLAPEVQFAEVHDETSFARWLERATNLELSHYRLVRHRNGHLEGFLGLWDQHPLKQLRVVKYSRKLAVPRLAFNSVARLAGAAPLPPPGGELRVINVVHLCTAIEEPFVLRALLLDALREWRGRGYSLLNLSLDERDPRRSALRGLFAQPTQVHAYATTPGGAYAGSPLNDRPFHHEIALV